MSSPNAQALITRPPVIVVMGHIDHGKSTLLDYIRKTATVDKEAGGITQHMGAYEAIHQTAQGPRKLTFLDTPGHAAFQGVRTRGAGAADIAILVVSAEDGVKPQTLEALNCIKTAGIPYIVAINKIDKPNASIDRTKQSLAENEIYVEGYGGDISCTAISAKSGEGVNELLDLVILSADILDLTYDASATPCGKVVDVSLDNKKGLSATLIIINGTLVSGQYVVAGMSYAPVRIYEDSKGKSIKSAHPSSPVKVYGWNIPPETGDDSTTVANRRQAEELIQKYKNEHSGKQVNIPKTEGIVLPLIVKADVLGSLEAIKHEFAKLSANEKYSKVHIRILSEGLGSITETDVKTALSAPGSIVLGFHVEPDDKARGSIERNNIAVKTFNIIYELSQYIENELVVRIPKEYIEERLGRAKVAMVFGRTKDRQVLGAKVQDGTIANGSEVIILRRDVEIGRGRIRELQQAKQRTDEVRGGFECGILVESKTEIVEGDKIEAFHVIEKK